MHALRRQLTEVNCKRAYQLEGAQKVKMFPKAEPKPPPEQDQIVTLMQNVYQAGRTSNIVGRKVRQIACAVLELASWLSKEAPVAHCLLAADGRHSPRAADARFNA